jgi:hypothetical protein
MTEADTLLERRLRSELTQMASRAPHAPDLLASPTIPSRERQLGTSSPRRRAVATLGAVAATASIACSSYLWTSGDTAPGGRTAGTPGASALQPSSAVTHEPDAETSLTQTIGSNRTELRIPTPVDETGARAGSVVTCSSGPAGRSVMPLELNASSKRCLSLDQVDSVALDIGEPAQLSPELWIRRTVNSEPVYSTSPRVAGGFTVVEIYVPYDQSHWTLHFRDARTADAVARSLSVSTGGEVVQPGIQGMSPEAVEEQLEADAAGLS